jgi:hypothetical protein
VVEAQATALLAGEKWDQKKDNPEFREVTRSVPTTNQRGESQFGLLRHLIDLMPSAKPTTLAYHVMMRTNRPMDAWFNGKTNEEQVDSTIRLLGSAFGIPVIPVIQRHTMEEVHEWFNILNMNYDE